MQSSIIEKLIINFFNEIEKRENKKNKNAKATFWVEELQEVGYNDENYLSVKKATRLYEKYVENKTSISVKEPNRYLCDFMSSYLGYDNFMDYSSTKKPEIQEEIVYKKSTININSEKKYKYLYGLLIVPFLILFNNLGKNNSENCIIWEENKFIESSCNSIHSINNLKYNIDVENFKKIEITDKTIFFIQGKPNVWYGKSKNGNYEYFSSRGIHPETMKELKPITKYIVKKYIKSKIDN